jgi:site-specific DNA-cytosine methylase
MVKGWSCLFTPVGLVVLGAGPPCQGVSGLNCDRKGALRDHRSNLYVHVRRVRQLVAEAFPWAQVHCLMESVQSIDSSDRALMSQDFGEQPCPIDALGVSLARRPRLYWITWQLQSGEGALVHTPEQPGWECYGTVDLQGKVNPSVYLTPGWTGASDQPLPTFTTARPRAAPGRRPAGLDKLTAAERQQWEQDSFRFPPYQYQTCFQLQRGNAQHLVSNIRFTVCPRTCKAVCSIRIPD